MKGLRLGLHALTCARHPCPGIGQARHGGPGGEATLGQCLEQLARVLDEQRGPVWGCSTHSM